MCLDSWSAVAPWTSNAPFMRDPSVRRSVSLHRSTSGPEQLKVLVTPDFLIQPQPLCHRPSPDQPPQSCWRLKAVFCTVVCHQQHNYSKNLWRTSLQIWSGVEHLSYCLNETLVDVGWKSFFCLVFAFEQTMLSWPGKVVDLLDFKASGVTAFEGQSNEDAVIHRRSRPTAWLQCTDVLETKGSF